MRPLRVPAFAWGGGSTALAAHTFGTDLEKERVRQELLAFIWQLCALVLMTHFRVFIT